MKGISKFNVTKKVAISSVLATLLASNIYAKSFQEDTINSLTGMHYGSIAIADLDGDSDLDIVTAGGDTNWTPTTKIYLNNGSGVFSEDTNNSLTNVIYSSVAIADLDGDSDNDILLTGKDANRDPISKIYLNDGSGGFSEDTTNTLEGVRYSSVAIADLDGDNDNDILLTGRNSSNAQISKIYTNNGSGSFSEDTTNSLAGFYLSSIAIKDLNGDNNIDIIISGALDAGTRDLKIYLGDGSGTFSEDTTNSLTPLFRGGIKVVDLDGDSDNDIVLVGMDGGMTPTSKIYLNDGTGSFNEDTNNSLQGVSYSSVAVADLDGDSHNDILLAGYNASNQKIAKVYLNDGSGSFSEDTTVPLEGVKYAFVAIADLDGDSHNDILLAGNNSNSKSITKIYSQDYTPPTLSQAVAKDNKLTLVFSEDLNESSTPATSDFTVTGSVSGSVNVSSVEVNATKVKLILDTTLKGEENITLNYTAGTNKIQDSALNNTTNLTNENVTNNTIANKRIFSEDTLNSLSGSFYGSITIADLDGDSDNDMLITGASDSSWTPSTKIYLNDGSGSFSEDTINSLTNVKYSSNAVADLDGDSDLDILITGKDSTNTLISKIYLNDGSGSFSEDTTNTLEGVRYSSVAIEDLDGDSDNDILITGKNSSSTLISKIYLNDGSGSFSEDTTNSLTGIDLSSVAIKDLNGDSYNDILITGEALGSKISKIYLNNGSGTFSEDTTNSIEGVFRSSIKIVDLDKDSDNDIVLTGLDTNGKKVAKIYLNNGSGSFSEDNTTSLEGVGYSSVAVADLDGDSYNDILLAGYNASNQRIAKVYLNDGSGTFNEDNTTSLEGVKYASSIAIADLDGDNHNDILLAGYTANSKAITKIYKKDYTPPAFSKAVAKDDKITLVYDDNLNESSTPATSDFTVVGSVSGAISVSSVEVNATKVKLTLSSSLEANESVTLEYTAGTNKLQDSVLNNISNLTNESITNNTIADKRVFFEDTTNSLEAIYNSSVATADLDGDGDLDILITGYNNVDEYPITKIYLNDGSGNFSEDTTNSLEGVQDSSVAIADLDGDSDLDILITGDSYDNGVISKIYLNNGSGSFSEDTTNSLEGVMYSSVAVEDLDGDSDLDILITGRSSTVGISKIYLNDGSGNFSEDTTNSLEAVYHSSVAIADLNGDSHNDILISGKDSNNATITKIYLNNGNGSFSEDTTNSLEGVQYSSVAIKDLNGDSYNDILITGLDSNDNKISKIYTNNGSGTFSEDTTNSLESITGSSVAIKDLDGDSYNDILMMGYSSNGSITKIYLNDGSGNFSEDTTNSLVGAYDGSVAIADLDGDSHNDILLTGYNSNGSIAKIYTRDFTPPTLSKAVAKDNRITLIFSEDLNESSTPATSDFTVTGSVSGAISVSSVEVNATKVKLTLSSSLEVNENVTLNYIGGTNKIQDGVLNSVSNLTNKTITNNTIKMATFSESTNNPLDGIGSSSINIADLDGDSDLDILITGFDSQGVEISKIYLNDGSGNFSEDTTNSLTGVISSSVAIADLDGDSDLDILITGLDTNDNKISKIYTNNGSGTFSEDTTNSLTGVQNSSVAIADLDGDNDLDILITGYDANDTPITKIYTNNGSGTFSEDTTNSLTGIQNSSVAIGDLDGDNDSDILISGYGTMNSILKIYLNDGNGSFSEDTSNSLDKVLFSSVAIADLNGDSYNDILITGRNSNNALISKIYLNNGSGVFSEDTTNSLDEVYNSSVVIEDLDGDSYNDILITGKNSNNTPISKIYLNDGSGTFNEDTINSLIGVYSSSIAIGDLNGDNHNNILITGRDSTNAISSKIYLSPNNDYDAILIGLNANKWQMVSMPKGLVVDTSTLSPQLASGSSIWAYRNNSFVQNPTTNAQEGLWIKPNSTTLEINGTSDTTYNYADKSSQLSNWKCNLSANTWNFVGVEYTTNWSDLTRDNITPDNGCVYSIAFNYDSVNDSWNSTDSISANSALFLQHICTTTPSCDNNNGR